MFSYNGAHIFLQTERVVELLHNHLSIMLPLCDELLTQAISLLEKTEANTIQHVVGRWTNFKLSYCF